MSTLERRQPTSGTRSPRWARSRATSSCSPAARARPVWDADGTEYLDATAGLWFANVGHGRDEIADAVATQLRTLAAHHIFGDIANVPALELAARVAGLAPISDPGDLLLHGRRRGDRHGREDRAPLLGAHGRARADGDRLAPPRLPRHERLRHVAVRASPPSATASARSSAAAPRSRTTIPTISPGRSTRSAERRRRSSASR